VWAIGEDVVNAFGIGNLVYGTTNRNYSTGVARWSGTSFAAPLVTGVLSDYIAMFLPGGQVPTGAGAGALAWLKQRFVPNIAGRVIVK
jgi:hypothetical protein